MTDALEPAPGGRSPRASEVLALVVVVAVIAAAGQGFAGSGLLTRRGFAVALALGIGLFGLPALAWLTERGRLTVRAATVVGACCGLLPALLIPISGVVGILVRGGTDYTLWALEQGAPVPVYGAMTWLSYASFLLWSVAVGTASGLTFALLVPHGRWRVPGSWGAAAAVLCGIVVLGFLLT